MLSCWHSRPGASPRRCPLRARGGYGSTPVYQRFALGEDGVENI
jgi:hypothetical protein